MDTWTKAYHWLQHKKVVKSITINNIKAYFTASNNKPKELSTSAVKAYLDKHTECNWSTFDGYVESESSMYCVIPNEAHWLKSFCSCPFFMKNYHCKHIIGICIRLNIQGCTIPWQAKTVLLGQKRKRGRIGKNKAALVHEPIDQPLNHCFFLFIILSLIKTLNK